MKPDPWLLAQLGTTRRALAATIALGLAAGVVVVGQARLLSHVVSQVFMGGQGLSGVAASLVILAFLALLRAGLAWGGEVMSHRVAGGVKQDLRARLVAHLLALGPVYAGGERSGELSTTLVDGVEALDSYFRHYLPQLALAALVPLAVLVWVVALDWVSGLVLLLTAPLIPVFMVLIGGAAEALTRRQWTALGRLGAHFYDVLQGLATLKTLGRSREQVQAIAQVSDRFREATMAVLRVAFLSALVLEMVSTIGTALVAVQVGLRLLYGHLTFEQALFVLVLAPEFYLPLRLLGTRFHAGMQGVAAARRIAQVLAHPVATDGELPGPATATEGTVAALTTSLELRDVDYAYEGGQRPALNGLSLRLQAGERLALVGPSGAGKSTVLALLLRFIAPDRGSITVDGRPLHDVSPAAWRQQIAWVPQAPTLFFGTVADNIRLGRPAAGPDELVWAARQAPAHHLDARLPHGNYSQNRVRGARLSGGEAQRLALARAFLQDAPLVLLDEATANLDPEVEQQIQEALGRLLRGRSALIVAHRLNTVLHADRILVLDAGRVVEEGRHEELLRQGGLYRRLVAAYEAGRGG